MRTEEDKVCQSPLVVTLGGKEYEIKPLVIKDSRAWRKQYVKAIGGLPGLVNTTTDTPAEFEKALTAILVGMPDSVIELFFAYAKDLPRAEIEAVATDQEIADGFKVIVGLAFPLAQSLQATIAAISQ